MCALVSKCVLCVGLCMVCVRVTADVKGFRYPGAGIMNQPDVNAGNSTQVLCKGSVCF